MMKMTRRMLMAAVATVPLMAGSAWAEGLITVIVNDPANPYWFTEGEVAKATAEELGYTANVAAHRGDTNTESTLIDAIATDPVAIILDPANADGSVGAVQKAVDAGIPVFLVNAEINQEGLAKAQLVSNNAQGAALGAQAWVEAMGEEGGQFVELFGNPSDNNAQTRSNGYETVLSQYPEFEKVGQEVANWDRTQGYQRMQSLLQANPDNTGVISGNDEMALGAIAALKEAGKLDAVTVGGFDGSPDAVEAVKAGEMA